VMIGDVRVTMRLCAATRVTVCVRREQHRKHGFEDLVGSYD
jgi:hypothetical protein